MKEGFVQIYTGEGKGKTTAAFGLAIRALGHGFTVCIIQFLKSTMSGEVITIKNLSGEIDYYTANTQKKFVWNMDEGELEILRKDTCRGFEKAQEAALSGNYDLVILDEAIWAVNNGYIALEEMLELFERRFSGTELVLTGRNAPAELIEKADLVTEMKKIKHPYDRGINARKGIEL